MCTQTNIEHLLIRLGSQSLPDRIDTMINAALETNGYYELPRAADTWSSQMVEIKSHGVSADGSSQEEAIRNWMKVAKNQMEASAAISLLRCDDHIHGDALKAACRTVLNHQGPTPHADHTLATQLLAVLERCA